MLRKAFSEGFISIVTPGSQLSPSSLEIKWEEELRLSIKGELRTCALIDEKTLILSRQVSPPPRT